MDNDAEVAGASTAEETSGESTEIVETETPEGDSTPPVESESKDENESESDPDGNQPAEKEHKKGAHAQKRIKQLLRENAELKQKVQSQQAVKEPVLPKLEDFDTVAEFNEALVKFTQEHGEYQKQQALKADEQKKFMEGLQKAWNKKVTAARSRIPEFNPEEAVVEVDPTPVMEGFFLDSDIGADVLHYLAENPDETERIREISSPYRQFRELLKLETLVDNKIKGIKPKPSGVKTTNPVKAAGDRPAAQKSAVDLFYS